MTEFLKSFIKNVLKDLPIEVKEITFDMNLYPDLSPSKTETGIKLKFTIKRK